MAQPADLMNMVRIKVPAESMLKEKNKMALDCMAGHKAYTQIKIKNKTEFDWPSDSLYLTNDYYAVPEKLPRLKKF